MKKSRIEVAKEMQIDSINVRNFRCLGDLKLTRLSPINVFVGRNNTGKSSLLEALALASSADASWHDSSNDDLIEKIVERRGGWKHADLMVTMGEEESEISVRGGLASGTLRIVSSSRFQHAAPELLDFIKDRVKESVDEAVADAARRRSKKYLGSEAMSGREPARIVERLLRSVNLSSIRAYMTYEGENPDLSESAALIGSEPLIPESIVEKQGLPNLDFATEESMRSSEGRASKTVFIESASVEYLSDMYNRLTVDGGLPGLIARLRDKINDFEDIRMADDEFYVYQKNQRKPFPIELMGDGFRAQLSILGAISGISDSVVLMEEPETRLHPGYMSTLVDQIVNVATNERLQFFISTHSIDFIGFLLEANLDLVKLVRMYREPLDKEEAMTHYEVFEGKDALEEMKDLKMDLRGV